MSERHDPSRKIAPTMDFLAVVDLLADLARERLRHEAATGRSRLITRRITHEELDARLAFLLGEIDGLQAEAADLPYGLDRGAQRKTRGLLMAARRARDLAADSARERLPARRDRTGPERRRRRFERALYFLVARSRALAAQLRAAAQRSDDAFDPGDLLTANELQHAFDLTPDHPLVRLELFAGRAERIAAEARAVFDAAPLDLDADDRLGYSNRPSFGECRMASPAPLSVTV